MASETTARDKKAERRRYKSDVLAAAKANHIWLNAFACFNPGDEFALALGRQVLAMLGNRGCTHRSECGYLLDLPMRELVICVNKS